MSQRRVAPRCIQVTRVLCVEDLAADFYHTRAILTGKRKGTIFQNEFALAWAQSLSAALAKLGEENFDVVLLDLSLPDAVGLEGFESIRAAAPHTPILVLSGNDDEQLAVNALQAGAQDYVVKDIADVVLTRAIRYAIERNRNLIQLDRISAEAVVATRAKSEFLANMSHEIRTPLTAIIGFAESIAGVETSQSERAFAAGAVLRNSHHLLKIIDDVLDMSKIEAGKLEIERIDCDLFSLLSDIYISMKLKSLEQGLHFSIDCDYPLPRQISTDPTRLRQILLNLISNAIKFTKRGSVTVSVSCDRRREMLTFAVADTGVGIALEQQHKMFGVFSQADSSITRQFGGTGLGLAISKRLAVQLGGELAFKSEPGRGSVFTLSTSVGSLRQAVFENGPIDFAAGNEEVARSEIIPRLEGRVLLAEDGLDNQDLIRLCLEKCGVETVVAANGEQAVERALAEHFDLLLMDMQMPVLDGYRATKKLRSRGFSQPIIALTASILDESIERCIRVGCNEHMKKPFARNELYSLLSRYLPERMDGETESEAAAAADESADFDDNGQLQAISNQFVLSLPGRLESLTMSFAGRRWHDLEQEAHCLKCAELFGFPEITEVAAEVETAVRKRNERAVATHLQKLTRIIPRRAPDELPLFTPV